MSFPDKSPATSYAAAANIGKLQGWIEEALGEEAFIHQNGEPIDKNLEASLSKWEFVGKPSGEEAGGEVSLSCPTLDYLQGIFNKVDEKADVFQSASKRCSDKRVFTVLTHLEADAVGVCASQALSHFGKDFSVDITVNPPDVEDGFQVVDRNDYTLTYKKG